MEIVILKGLVEGDNGKSVFEPLIAHEPFRSIKCIFAEDAKDTDEFADEMKKWFENAGVPNVKVFTTGADIPPETAERLSNGQANIVFDRHTAVPDLFKSLTKEGVQIGEDFWGANLKYADRIKEKSALQTPVENFYVDVRNKVAVEADPKKVEESIRKMFKEKLLKIKEKADRVEQA